MPRILSALKNAVLPSGSSIRSIKGGLLKGLKFNIDLTTGMQIYMGLSERELAPWFEKFSKNAKTAIDVGASQGYYTLYFLARTAAKRIYSFEPSEECRSLMGLNLRANALENTERLELSSKFVGGKNDAEHCTLDSLVEKLKFPAVVKLDIEGGEGEALGGATKLLHHPEVRWIIEAHSRALEAECLLKLHSFGYKTRLVKPTPLRLIFPELRPADHNSWIIAF